MCKALISSPKPPKVEPLPMQPPPQATESSEQVALMTEEQRKRLRMQGGRQSFLGGIGTQATTQKATLMGGA